MVDLDEVRLQHHLRHRGQINKRLALTFWLVICSILFLRVMQINLSRWSRRRGHSFHRVGRSKRPVCVVRFYAIIKAVSLLSFPQWLGFSLSLGQTYLLVAYAGIIILLLVSVEAPSLSSHFIDDVAFRASWISLAQVPFVYVIATKRGPLNVLGGISYERINWIHRWAGRVLLFSATVHMSIMMTSISIAELLKSPDRAMCIVRYGVGAYGALVWAALTSILPLRRWSYRAFYINHSITSLAFLWVLFRHVPSYARNPIYAAIGIITFERCFSFYLFLRNNMGIRPIKRRFKKYGEGTIREELAIGHSLKMVTPTFGHSNSPFSASLSIRSPDSVTVIRICDMPFSWRAGQHVRLYIPQLGRLEIHPLTPANYTNLPQGTNHARKDQDVENDCLIPRTASSVSNDMIFFVRPHTGWTRRLAQYHSEWLSRPCPNSSQSSSSLTAYIDGPYGTPPCWEKYVNLVLIATSTGVAFILSILDYLEHSCCERNSDFRTRKIRFVWSVRHLDPQLDATITDMLIRCTNTLRQNGVAVTVEFYVTCLEANPTERQTYPHDSFAAMRPARRRSISGRPPLRIRNPSDIVLEWEEDLDTEDSSSHGSAVSSTFIGEDGQPSVSDLQSPSLPPERFWWQKIVSNPVNRTSDDLNSSSCDCRIIQQQHPNMDTSPKFIQRIYDVRPNVSRIISSSVLRSDIDGSLVAICSNLQLTSQAKNLVAQMNFDFVRGQRESAVDIFSECFF